jgi:tellurite methyltransferase
MDKFPSRWQTYHEKASERPPHPSLVEAFEFVSHKDAALDLGAGSLNDSKFLLTKGFSNVLAVDAEPSVSEKADTMQDERLKVTISKFESFDFPANAFDLINAQYSLPFTSPESFDDVFKNMKNSLKKDGIFVGELFGENDSFKDRPTMTFHSLKEVENLFSDMKVIEMREDERDGSTVSGDNKHWHVFTVIARK